MFERLVRGYDSLNVNQQNKFDYDENSNTHARTQVRTRKRMVRLHEVRLRTTEVIERKILCFILHTMRVM